jgi:hypothetical protein
MQNTLIILTICSSVSPQSPFHLWRLVTLGATLVFWIPCEIIAVVRLGSNSYWRKKSPKILDETKLDYIGVRNNFITQRPLGTSNLKLEQILRIEHLILPIAASLHYVDLVSIGRTSRSIRESVFPHLDLVYRKRKLTAASCQGRKTKCWNCSSQVCYEEYVGQFYYHSPTAQVTNNIRRVARSWSIFKNLIRPSIDITAGQPAPHATTSVLVDASDSATPRDNAKLSWPLSISSSAGSAQNSPIKAACALLTP